MQIHSLSASEIARRLSDEALTSVEVVEALRAHADAVEPKVNAFTQRLDDDATEQARQSDQARAEGRPQGMLAGLPITIKESIAMAGFDSTLGLESRKARPASDDATVVRLLRGAGAIVIGRTNVSQLLLFHEAENGLFGTTNNPWDTTRVPGGSSGGEAAAIAAGLSPWGVGTDIGGSIRVPCAFTGIAGLKPTLDRWSNRGVSTALSGQEVIRGQCGPMARTVEDVGLLLRAIDPIAQARLDPSACPLPWSEPDDVSMSSLRVGFFEDDGFLAASAPIARAVRRAAEILEAAGARVERFVPPHAVEIIDLYFAALSSDGGATVDRLLQGERIVPQLAQLKRIASMPSAMRKAAAVAMGLAGEPRVKRLLEVVHEKSVHDYWRLTAERTRLKNAVFDRWVEGGLDAVICPAHATVALRHRDAGDFSIAGCYSMRYNFVNFPAGVVPVTKVSSDDRVRTDPSDRIERKAAAIEDGSVGLPVAVQVAARPHREDVVLAVMQAIEDGAKGSADYPSTPVGTSA